MKELVAVTIPIYKQNISEEELASLTRCLNILGKYKIIFFAPASLDTSFYENFCHNKIDFAVERFADDYFIDIPGYNRLMLSTAFYKRFNNYKYILIYQLDAYVFKDELTYWCNKNYSYIAAPGINFIDITVGKKQKGGTQFLSRYTYVYNVLNFLHISNYKFRHIENGGFSLRKVSSFITLLTVLKKRAEKWPINEDTFFMYLFNILFFLFKLPEELTALKFSFEQNPRNCYKLNNYRLPFGCHAFNKYDPDFWAEFISQ